MGLPSTGGGRVNVVGAVVGKQKPFGIDFAILFDTLINLCCRFCDAHMARDVTTVKFAQEIIVRFGKGEGSNAEI